MCGLGISGCNDSVLGDSVQSGVVTEEKIDGATGGLPSPAAQRAGRAEPWRPCLVRSKPGHVSK